LRSALTSILPIVIAVAIAAAAFVYRFNTLDGKLSGFENDHFPQLVRSMAMLEGERPLRDFTDAELRALWPAPTYSTSALAQRVLGRSLRSEALLTIGMLSIGAAALFLVSVQFAGSILPAAIAALLAVALRPALYNYPKIVLYVFAIAAMLAYARRPTTGRLVVLGVTIGVAALFRHDHGVYLGIAAGALLAMLHGPRVARPLAALAVTCAAIVGPGVVLAQIDGGFVTYLRECVELSRAEAARTTNTSFRFSVDMSQPLLRHIDPAEIQPRIAVRWVPTLTPDDRTRAEQELQLSNPVVRTDESNWSYTISDASAAHLAGVVRDPRVLDTDGIDRSRFVLTTPLPPAEGWIGTLLRWRIAPGIFRYENATPWLYVVAWGVMLCAVACVVWSPFVRTATSPGVPPEAIRAVCLLGVLMLIALLRTPNASRFADISVAVAIVGSWLLGAIPRRVHAAAPLVRLIVVTALTVVLLISGWAIMALADVPHQIGVAGLTDRRLSRQWKETWGRLGALPSSLLGIDDDLQRTSAYLRRCTSPTDRVFMGENLPEIFYFADRPFAAGQVRYFSNFYSSAGQQREAIERWSHQVVPIALAQAAPRFDEEFAADYPLLAEYLRVHYRRAGTLRVEPGAVVDVWVDRARTFVTDQASGLPCEPTRD
jgi:hypothetical protein